MDCSPPGCRLLGLLHWQADSSPTEPLEAPCSVACLWAQAPSQVQLFATPLTVARLAPLSMGFSRQGYWSGLPFPSPTLLGYIDPMAAWIVVLWRGGTVLCGVHGLYPQDASFPQVWQPKQPQTFQESVVENRWEKGKQKWLESCSIYFEFVAGSPRLYAGPQCLTLSYSIRD